MDTVLHEKVDSWAMKVRDWETVENNVSNLENTTFITFHDVTYFSDYRDVTRAVLYEGQSPAPALSAIRNKTQTHLDRLFN